MTNRIRLRIAEDNRLKRLPLLLAMLLILLPSAGFAGNFIAFGPESFTRSSGSPVTVTNNFTVLNPNTTYTLRISNGGLTDGEFEKVSSSVISLNGFQIVGPSEFNQNVSVIEKPVTLATNNELAVELRGKPGGGITIQIIGVDDDPPNISISSPADGVSVDASPVAVTGTVSDALSGVAAVTCNGTPASLSDASFNCDVSLIDGPNTILVEATDLAGNVGSSSITVDLAAGGLAVTITSPAPGSIINASTVIVQGVVDAPVGAEVGVTVNGIPALVSDSQFAALVPVDEDVDSLTATAASTAGSTGSDTIPVTVQSAVSDLLFLTPSPGSGLAPLQVKLRASFLGPATNYQWDIEGDGTIDLSGPDLVEVTQEYLNPGLYFPTVIVTDSQGVQFMESVPVLVFSQDHVVALLQAKWQEFKDTLRTGDIPGALQFIAQDNRTDYQEIFQNLTVPLSAIDQVLTEIQFVQFRERTAEFEMLRTDERGELSYLVRFVIDQDGIWRIKDM